MADLRWDCGLVTEEGAAQQFEERKQIIQDDPACSITHERIGDNQWIIVYDYEE